MTETAGADDRAAEATTDTALAARRTTAGANAREVLENLVGEDEEAEVMKETGTSRGLGESPEEGPALILALDLQVQERTATLPQPPITPRKRYPAGDTPLHALGPHRGPARGPGPGPDVNRGGIRRHRGERRLCF